MVFDAGTNIDVGTGADICADVCTINGTYSGNGTLCEGQLPVELSSFTASVEKKSVHLAWRTETEVDNYGFEILRRIYPAVGGTQDDEWDLLGFVEGHGNSNSPKDYSYLDKNPFGGSTFKYRLKQIDTDGKYKYSDEIEAEIIPTEFALYQNYPNPFNPSTKIRYQLPMESKVIIKLYDILGSEVRTLLNKEMETGVYEVILNAAQLPSGTYFYRLEAGDPSTGSGQGFAETKKMMLMK
jgi:hypothetical protein